MARRNRKSRDKQYETCITAGDEYQKNQRDRWDASIRLYKGEIVEMREKKMDEWVHLIEVNFTRPTIDDMRPNIIFQTPKVMVTPPMQHASHEMVQQALSVENTINVIQQEIDMGDEFSDATQDALLIGDGFVKVGKAGDLGYDPEMNPHGQPFMKRWSPWELGIDPGARCRKLSDAEWVWFRYLESLDSARKDKTLHNPQRLQAIGVSTMLPEHLQDRSSSELRSYEFTALYELWHRETGKVVTVDSVGRIYKEREWPKELPELQIPLIHVSFNHVPEEFYCMSEAEYLHSLQLEASEKRTQQLNHTRRFNRKYRVSQDVSEEDVVALREGPDGTVVRSSEPVDVIADAPLQADIPTEYAMIQSEVREVSGISAYRRGGSEKGVYSATEARMIDASANIRIEERRNKLAKTMGAASKLLYNFVREDYGWPELAFNFRIDISTMKRPDDEGRKRELIELAGVLQQVPEFKREAFAEDLAIAFNKDPKRYVSTPEEMQAKQQPDPAQQKAQAEMQKMQAEMQMEQAKMQMDQQKAQMDMQMQQQKAALEMEKLKAELQIKMQDAQIEREKAQTELAIEREKLNIEREKLEVLKQKSAMELQIKTREAQNDMILKEKKQNADIRLSMSKVQQDSKSLPKDKGSGSKKPAS